MYCSKALNDPLNTHGFYVTGIDDAAKNVQSTINVSQGNSQLYLTAGHANPGSGMVDYSVLLLMGRCSYQGVCLLELQINKSFFTAIRNRKQSRYNQMEKWVMPQVQMWS